MCFCGVRVSGEYVFWSVEYVCNFECGVYEVLRCEVGISAAAAHLVGVEVSL